MRDDQAESQRQIEQVRDELLRFQEAARLLELQKLENGKLKETVDNLKLEVEGLTQRLRLGASSQSDLRSGSQANHVRSLGSELGSEVDEDTSGSDTEEETGPSSREGGRGRATSPSLSRSNGSGPEGRTTERHIIYRTRTLVGLVGIDLVLAADVSRVGQVPHAPENGDNDTPDTFVYEDDVDVADQGCQTNSVGTNSLSVQTDPTDDPPSYDESSGTTAKPQELPSRFGLSIEIESCNRRLLQACYTLPFTSAILRRVPQDWHPFFINVLAAVVVLSSPAFIFGWTCGFAAARWYATHILWLAVDTYEIANDLGPTNQLSFLLRE